MTDLQRLSEKLTADEVEIVRRCLQAAVEGSFFPESEFGTIMGVERGEVRAVWLAWPNGNVEASSYVAGNVLNNLLGYPHRKDDELLTFVPEGLGAIESAFDALRSASGQR